MALHNKHHLRRWPSSYYFPNGKKWLSPKWTQGTLFVDYKAITFYRKYDRDRPLRIIPFSEITGIKRATSTMVFSALVISVNDQSHWFSSLPNRDAAYMIIEHFWRERLIPKKPRLGSVSSGNRTKMGTELLQLAEESQSTLQAAGTMLQNQGEQLDRAMGVMFDLNNDLDVAEKFISGFEGWVGNWKLPKSAFSNEPIEIIDSRAVPTVYDFPVLYAAWSEGAGSAPKNGTLRISRDGITIMDDEQLHVHHYHIKGVSAIRVLSPWEMTVSKYLIGQPDITYLLMSTHMVNVLKALEPLYKDRMDFVEPPPGQEPVSSPDTPPAKGSIDHSDEEQATSPQIDKCMPGVRPLHIDTNRFIPQRRIPLHTTPQIQTQIAATEQIVSEAEAEELKDVVARMKSMAMDIGNEQASQLEKIDSLTGTVDRANDRIKADTSRVKLLLK